MDSVKSFFAKDIVKIIFGGLLVVANGLVIKYVPDPDLKLTVLSVLNSVAAALGIASGGTSNLRSDQSRANLAPLTSKPPTGYLGLSLLIILALGAAILVSAPIKAKAAPLVKCLAGCDERVLTVGPFKDSAPVITPTATLWLAPSVGVSGYTRYSKDGVWAAGVSPGAGYGLKWKPSSWTLTSVALALDLYGQIALTGSDSTSRRLGIDVLPVLTVANVIGGGCGHRWLMAMSAGQRDEHGWLCMIAVTTTTGVP